MRDNTRTIVFAVALAVVCSAVLAMASLYTAPYRRANEKADEVRNFLAVLEVPVEEKAGAESLLRAFEKNIRSRKLGKLAIYEYVPESYPSSRPIAIAVPFSGQGLWGPIKGVLALEPDLVTIRGIRFYRHEETPGLGGEISADWFQKRFVGKRIESSDNKAGFRVLKSGSPDNINSVDGITGATMTSERIGAMLDALAQELAEERKPYGQ